MTDLEGGTTVGMPIRAFLVVASLLCVSVSPAVTTQFASRALFDSAAGVLPLEDFENSGVAPVGVCGYR